MRVNNYHLGFVHFLDEDAEERSKILSREIKPMIDILKHPCKPAAVQQTDRLMTSAKQPSSTTDQKITSVAREPINVNATLAILQLGFRKMEHDQLQQNVDINEARSLQQKMEKLLRLNSELSLGEKDIVLSDAACERFKEFKESYHIEFLRPDEKELSPSRIVEIKSQITSQGDLLKTTMQTLFTTRINVRINETNSLTETLRMFVKYSDRLIANVTQRSSPK
jgi:hypothetical protein